MDEPNKPAKWFYRLSETSDIQGPYDLVELAGFLATGDITAETATRTEHGEEWLPFGERREYTFAKEMPPGIILRHLDAEIPEPETFFTFSRKLYYLGALVFGIVLYTLKLYFFFPYSHQSRHDSNGWLMALMRLLMNNHSGGGS